MLKFEWSDEKDIENQKKHNASFSDAQEAFFDPKRIISIDERHNKIEERFFCIGKVNNQVLTVRFTLRGNKIRIYGAGYWRKGKKHYEEENSEK